MIGIGWLFGLLLLLFGGADFFGGSAPSPWPGASGGMASGESAIFESFLSDTQNAKDCGLVIEDGAMARDAWRCLDRQRDRGRSAQLIVPDGVDGGDSSGSTTRFFVVLDGLLRVYTDTMDPGAGTDEWSVVECPAPADLSQGCPG
ncbi:MAG: hypothetical protein R2731_13850 [Nocardioides sp.]